MACPVIHTGERFLASVLLYVDCQAQTIGSYGFGALADPGSPVTLALTSLLTIFVALFGIRLLLGYPIAGRDLIGDVLRIGIVLTLITSWPAWRVIGYDMVISGPGEIARVVGGASRLPGASGDLLARLDWTDRALAALNIWGSGRLGIAQGDWFQLGFARSAYLIGTLAPLSLVRLIAGILLALAPLMAGLLLFGITRSIFAGWARALVATYLASITLTLILGVELALLEPWLQEALERRAAGQQILDAPVEILVTTLVFALVSFGSLALVIRMAFYSSVLLQLPSSGNRAADGVLHTRNRHLAHQEIENDAAYRARRVSLAVSESISREERFPGIVRGGEAGPRSAAQAATGQLMIEGAESLGSSYRRNARRVSGAGQKRDEVR